MAAALGVEERGEEAGAVEAGPAEEVDGAVGGDERHRRQVADDAVILDAALGPDATLGHAPRS